MVGRYYKGEEEERGQCIRRVPGAADERAHAAASPVGRRGANGNGAGAYKQRRPIMLDAPKEPQPLGGSHEELQIFVPLRDLWDF